ncbi:hypothetical protein Ocin01_05104 [Orchesella cincta]|uniref:Death domain-containing protein n=1 Tax=Orchesella cincta TaxID=48709 RepID=A0A1D2N8M3_ORCCI|nr:hypothetical protein Ocin01_05104 [Orchesella cincta]
MTSKHPTAKIRKMDSAREYRIFLNGSGLSNEGAKSILRQARLNLTTQVFKIQANNDVLAIIPTFGFEDAELELLNLKPVTPQDWTSKFIDLLLNRKNVAECLTTLCNLHQHQYGLSNYQCLVVQKLNEIPNVEVVEVKETEQPKLNRKLNDTPNVDQKPNNLVVGDDPCSYNKVTDTLAKCKGARKLWDRLMELADELEIPSDDAVTISRGLKNETKTNTSGLREILQSWRAKQARNAYLSTLVDVLQNMNLGECAVALSEQF